MTITPDKDVESKCEPQETKEAIKEPSPWKKIQGDLFSHCLTFLGGLILAGLWLKFVSFHRYEVEWGMDLFRDPKILVVMTTLFFLTGMGLVCGIRHIIAWVKECHTYS